MASKEAKERARRIIEQYRRSPPSMDGADVLIPIFAAALDEARDAALSECEKLVLDEWCCRECSAKEVAFQIRALKRRPAGGENG